MSDDTKQREAFIADLEMVRDRLQGIADKLIADCKANGDEYTDEEAAKFDGGFMMVRGVLMDELNPMLDCWKDGAQFSRKGEQLMGRDRPNRRG